MAELIPCPFCGSEAKVVTNYQGQSSVECTNRVYCIASQMVFWDWEEDAIAAWNRRYDPEVDDGR